MPDTGTRSLDEPEVSPFRRLALPLMFVGAAGTAVFGRHAIWTVSPADRWVQIVSGVFFLGGVACSLFADKQAHKRSS